MSLRRTRTKRTRTRKKKTVITKRRAQTFILAICVAALFASAPAKKEDLQKHYALIFGTAYGPDDHPFYGVKISIHPVGAKHPNWDLSSDHRGEFAQRVPPGPSDYLIHGEAKFAPAGPDGKPQMSKIKTLKGDTKVHVENEERLDISVHLTE